MECAGSSMTTLMFIFTTVATTLATARGEENYIIEGPIEAVESLRDNQAFDLVELVDKPLDTDTLLSTTLFKRIKKNVGNEVNFLFQNAGNNQKYPTQDSEKIEEDTNNFDRNKRSPKKKGGGGGGYGGGGYGGGYGGGGGGGYPVVGGCSGGNGCGGGYIPQPQPQPPSYGGSCSVCGGGGGYQQGGGYPQGGGHQQGGGGSFSQSSSSSSSQSSGGNWGK